MFSLVVIVFLMIFISTYISKFTIIHILGVSDESINSVESLITTDKNMGKLLIAINHILIFIVGSFIYLFIFYKNEIRNYLQLKHFPPSFLLLFPLALLTLYPTMGYLAQMINKIELPSFLQSLDKSSMESLESLLVMDNFWDLLSNILIVGVIAGIGEELLFRGLIQKELIKTSQKPHLAIGLTALLFSIFHFQIGGFFPKLLIGALLGYAYYFSQSLILPMFLHFINNSFATFSLFYLKGDLENIKTSENQVSGLSVVISLVVFLWLFHIIFRSRISQNNSIYE